MNMIKNRGFDRSVWVVLAVLSIVGGWSHASLINHWKFDETNGVAVAADSAGSLPVTLRGNTAFVTDETRGQVLELGGTVNDYANNSGEPFINTVDHTVAVWVNHRKSGSFNGIWLSWGTLNGGRYFLGPHTANVGKIIAGQALNTHMFTDSYAAPVQNTWQHWAFSRKGVELRLYLNGEIIQVMTNYNTAGVIGSASGLQIGRSYDEKAPLDGRMDDLAIWDEALTQAQIQKAMTDGAGYSAPLQLNHWKFDESTGLTAEDSAGSLPVALVNGATFVTDATRGQVLELDGVNDYATNSGEPFTNDMTHTVALWAKHNDTPPFSAWLSWGAGSARYFLLPYAPSGAVVSGIGSDALRRFTAPGSVPTSGTWQHWAFVRNLETLTVQLYRNGIRLQTMNTADGGVITANGVLRIGADPSGSLLFNGRMDDVSVWQGALTPTEIQSAMKFGAENFNQPPTLALIHHWKFDEAPEATVASDSAGNLPVTLQNGAVFTNDTARGRVLELDGDNDYAVNASGVPFTADIDHTVALWVNHHDSGSFSGIWLSWGIHPPISRYVLGPNSANGGKIISGSGEDVFHMFCGANAAPVPNTWQHWAFVRKGRQLQIYLNGVHVETQMKDSGSAISVGGGLQIGRSYEETCNLNGRMDDLAIWQGALSVEQIQNAMIHGAEYYRGPPVGTLILIY